MRQASQTRSKASRHCKRPGWIDTGQALTSQKLPSDREESTLPAPPNATCNWPHSSSTCRAGKCCLVPELAEPGGLTFRPGSSTSARKVAPLSGAVDEEYNPVQIFKKTERQRGNHWLIHINYVFCMGYMRLLGRLAFQSSLPFACKSCDLGCGTCWLYLNAWSQARSEKPSNCLSTLPRCLFWTV